MGWEASCLVILVREMKQVMSRNVHLREMMPGEAFNLTCVENV